MNPRLLPPIIAMATLLALIFFFSPDGHHAAPVPKSGNSDALPAAEARNLVSTPTTRVAGAEAFAKVGSLPVPGSVSESATVEAPESEKRVNIGEYMDPNDPSTWPQDANQAAVNIGEYMDPDDPSTWPVDESSEVVNIGQYMDPDDPSTWSVGSDSGAVPVNVGEYRDPDNPQTWPIDGSDEPVNIGEYRDPDDPSSGSFR